MKDIYITEELAWELKDVFEKLIAPDEEMQKRKDDMINAITFLAWEDWG